MSTSIGEAENIISPNEVATEIAASQAPAMSDAAIAATNSGLPSAALKYLIDSVHSFTQLPSAALQSLIDDIHSFTGFNW